MDFNFSTIQIIFYVTSLLTLFGGLGTILSKNSIHSILYLILTFFSLSAHYILMNAQFLAAVNIIVYAGAIMVLFLFVVMFLNIRQESNELKNNLPLIASTVLAVIIGVMLIGTLRQQPSPQINPMTYNSQGGMIENLGNLLYKDYMLPFELISILFLVAMVGAVMLGKREKGERNF